MSTSVMTDVMVDIETTGTNPAFGNIIQLAAIKFNYETGEIGETFDRCLAFAPNRFWDESTRSWWNQQKPGILRKIIDRMEDPGDVIEAYQQYAMRGGQTLRFWSRGSFDWFFIESYLTQYGLIMPHKFWEQRDLRSYIAGLGGAPEERDLTWVKSTIKGDAHNALYDCVAQLKALFAARDGHWHEVLP